MTDENTGVIEPTAEVQHETPQVSDKEINLGRLREKAETLERQNNMMMQRMMELERRGQETQSQQKYNDDDIPTYGDLNKIRQQDQQEVNHLKEMIADLKMRGQYTDYDKTVREYLPDILKDDPDLAMAIKDNPQMHKLAYKLAQASPRYHQEKLASQNSDKVQRIVENASRPQPSNARKAPIVADEDASLRSMSDTDIMRTFNMAKARY
jgi:hypothetical protein